VLGQALLEELDVARVDVDPDGARRQVAQVQPGATAGIEDGCIRGGVLGDHLADDPRSVAVEERLQAAQVVGHVDPVIGLDVAVVVRARAGASVLQGVRVRVILASREHL